MTTRFTDHLPYGDLAARPLTTAAPIGALYSATDEATIYKNLEAGWEPWAELGTAGAAGVNLVDKLEAPFYVAHRGSHLIYPEHSMEGYRASAEAGYFVEPDLRALSDGTIVCHHDATVDAEHVAATGTVASKDRAYWDAAHIKAAATGGKTAKPAYWADVLAEFGGRSVIFAEIKDDAIAQAVIDTVIERSLQDAVILQSFTYSVAQAVAAAGCRALFLTDTEDAATMLADGIEWFGPSTSATQTYVQDTLAAGMRAILWTSNAYQESENRFGWGVDGIFSDDPWRVSRKYAPYKTRELFDSADPQPNVILTTEGTDGAATGTTVIDPLVPAWSTRHLTAAGNYRANLLLGQFGYGAMTGLKVRFKAKAFSSASLEATSVTQWIWGLYIGEKTTTGPFVEDVASEKFYLLVQRRNGARGSWYKDFAGTPSSIGTTAAPGTPYCANAASGSAEYEYEVEVTATQIIVRNLTLADTDLVVTHSTFRSSNAILSLRANNGGVDIKDVRVVR